VEFRKSENVVEESLVIRKAWPSVHAEIYNMRFLDFARNDKTMSGGPNPRSDSEIDERMFAFSYEHSSNSRLASLAHRDNENLNTHSMSDSTGKIIVSALSGAAIAAVISGTFNLRLEREKLNYNTQLERSKLDFNLLQGAVHSTDEEANRRSLRFLLKLKLIQDSALTQQLQEILDSSDEPLPPVASQPQPTLSSPAPSQSTLFVASGWAYFGTFKGNAWQNATFKEATGKPEVGKFYRTTQPVFLHNNRPTAATVGRGDNGVLTNIWVRVEEVSQTEQTGSVWCRVNVVTDKYQEDTPPQLASEPQ
jgi:hypothetical protein